ncbi:MAG: alginate lyase family protein, partial [Gammaproteobacteria bacterium]|nr:alginate lyase family protein [Gammaproteobacteria bacterium]
TQTAWEPYTVSLRIVNWIKFLLRFDGRVSPSVVRSLALQSHWLYQNIELHILANHLFKNIKALLFAGTWLQGEAPTRWFARAQTLLHEQLREQLLIDGGHYERSPMYHSIFVEDLLDLLNYRVPGCYRNETLALLENSALQASLFLRDIRMPDGQIPLFNDAAFAIAPEPDVILDYSRRVLNKDLSDTQHFPRQISFPATGYFIIGEGDDRLIIDCGETGPRYQPGHTHCDTLSFELAIKGQRVIVDTGTYDYEPGAKRRYDRSTAAHNTLMIDGIDQSEVWGLFRVARRASPLSADLSIEADGKAVFCGSHDGYQRLRSKLTHVRQVNFDPARGWRIEDTVTGRGEHRIESFIHLHPRLQPQENGGQGFRLLDADGKAVAEIVIAEGLDADVSNTVYHPQFGVEQPCKVIRILYKGEVPATLGYDINIL